VIKVLLVGAAAAGLLASQAAAASAARRPDAPAWVIAPGTDNCRTELEFTGVSGVAVPASLVSNGEDVDLVVAKADAPERAFLPIRIDHKPFANLMMRQADGKTAAIQLSAETLTALGKGGALQIGWLADEPVQIGLAGSEQALADLRTCGAQVAQRFRDQQAARQAVQLRADAEARAQALADEQLAVVRAQKAAAEAEAQRNTAEAERLQAAADADRQRAQAEAEAARQRAEQQAQADSYPYQRARDYPDDSRDSYYAPDPYPAYQPPNPYRRW
jgi:hypothetical protein